MSRLADVCDPTRIFPQENVGPKRALAASCSDQLLPESRSDNRRVGEHRFGVSRFGGGLQNGDRRVRIPVRLADETDERIGERLWNFRQVDGLQTVAALLKR